MDSFQVESFSNIQKMAACKLFRNHIQWLQTTPFALPGLNITPLHSLKTSQVYRLRILNCIINTHSNSTHRAEFMLKSFLRERVAAETCAESEVDRDLGRRTIGKDSAHLFILRALISTATKIWK